MLFSRIENKMLRVGLTCSVFVIILILSYLFIGRPILKYKERLKAEFSLNQNKLQESQALVRSFSNPQKALEDIGKKAQELKEMGVSSRQLPRIIQSLALPASKLNINLTSIRPREDIKPGNENLPAGVSKVYIELAMSCPYQLFAEYTRALSELPVTFILERLSIEKEEKGSASARTNKPLDKSAGSPEELSITLLLSTYMVWEI